MSINEASQSARNDIIAGRNAVREVIVSGRPIDCIMIAKGERQGSLHSIIELAKKSNIPVREVSPVKLDSLCPGGRHQGVAAMTAAHEYADPEDIFTLAAERGEAPFIVICDGISDPHNLGAIVRSAEAAGAHGVVIPKRRATGLTWTVGKASAGALEHIPVARVANISQYIEEIKKRGVWVCCADMDGKPYYESPLSGAIAVVVGSEGDGVSRLVKEKCDFVVSIPMRGKINSLNASCACAVVLFEVTKNRLCGK